MTRRKQLGWRVSASVYEQFKEHVFEKYEDQSLYLRVGLEEAMQEYLSHDQLLEQIDKALPEGVDVRGFSSSTALTAVTDRYEGDKKLLTNRVRADLKDEFKQFADRHDKTYGKLLTAAMSEYAAGGRERRLLNAFNAVFEDAIISGSNAENIETNLSTPKLLATNSAKNSECVETGVSTASDGATTDGSNIDEDLLQEIIREFEYQPIIPTDHLNDTIAKTVENGQSETIEDYRTQVVDRLELVECPHENRWLTKDRREALTLWADLDRQERTLLLRRYIVLDAIEENTSKHKWDYNRVMDEFEERTLKRPSVQYAYDLMGDAADQRGFDYGRYSISSNQQKKKVLRANLEDVHRSTLQWVCNEFPYTSEKVENLLERSVSTESIKAADDD